ncbi:MAG TPA: glycosyltransferase [Thermoanaerobaculia bacterium]|nr:glycosyltransferase [Thermoanaerobaculia bacterium]
MTIRARALYICYFGLREPLVQTQVLPYLRELVARGIGMSLLTFEPSLKTSWDADSIAGWRRRLRVEGIEWHLLPYHKRPSLPATLYDIVVGAWRAAAIARRGKIDLFHGRSYVGMAIGALAKRLTGAKLIFDVRGLLAEEYVDSGNWPAGGMLYRLTKAAERWLDRAADGFVVLTDRARETRYPEGGSGRPVEVIPCCVDPERFAAAVARDRDAIRRELGLEGRRVFVYLGALGGYYLIRETAELLAAAREQDPHTYALVLTQGLPAPMTAELQRLGFSNDDYRVLRVAPEDVPTYLRAADIALALIRPSFARRSMSPTKFAEYLAAGLPVIASAGTGDLDVHIREGRAGVLLKTFDHAAYLDAFRVIEELMSDPGQPERCRAEARARYDLHTIGGERYRRLYAAVLGP